MNTPAPDLTRYPTCCGTVATQPARRVWRCSVAGRGARGPLGFTLIEVLIAIAIVAILATIAYPSYVESIRKSNGRAAQGFLMDVATRQKQYLLDQRRYAGSLEDLGMTAPSDVARNYSFSFTTTNTPPAFVATATAKAGSRQAGSAWQALSLNSRGVKTPADKW